MPPRKSSYLTPWSERSWRLQKGATPRGSIFLTHREAEFHNLPPCGSKNRDKPCIYHGLQRNGDLLPYLVEPSTVTESARSPISARGPLMHIRLRPSGTFPEKWLPEQKIKEVFRFFPREFKKRSRCTRFFGCFLSGFDYSSARFSGRPPVNFPPRRNMAGPLLLFL